MRRDWYSFACVNGWSELACLREAPSIRSVILPRAVTLTTMPQVAWDPPTSWTETRVTDGSGFVDDDVHVDREDPSVRGRSRVPRTHKKLSRFVSGFVGHCRLIFCRRVRGTDTGRGCKEQNCEGGSLGHSTLLIEGPMGGLIEQLACHGKRRSLGNLATVCVPTLGQQCPLTYRRKRQFQPRRHVDPRLPSPSRRSR